MLIIYACTAEVNYNFTPITFHNACLVLLLNRVNFVDFRSNKWLSVVEFMSFKMGKTRSVNSQQTNLKVEYPSIHIKTAILVVYLLKLSFKLNVWNSLLSTFYIKKVISLKLQFVSHICKDNPQKPFNFSIKRRIMTLIFCTYLNCITHHGVLPPDLFLKQKIIS